ncbi:MAG: hypothetical protein R2991_00025 [Thermoanaerobaculia bacterium]
MPDPRGGSITSGAYKWGRRHNKVGTNPVAGFELPGSTRVRKTVATPQLDELVNILNGADNLDPELAPILKLAATTGMRRAELAGLRRDRLNLARHELTADLISLQNPVLEDWRFRGPTAVDGYRDVVLRVAGFARAPRRGDLDAGL